MRSDIVPGGIFPNYELPDHTGELRKLSELQEINSLDNLKKLICEVERAAGVREV